MRSWIIKLMVMIGVLSLGPGLVASYALAAGAEKPEQFYRGKTITWIVSSGRAGDTTDFVTRLVAPYLAKETGAKVKVRNMGSAKGINYVYTDVKPDGLTLVTRATTAVLSNYVLKAPGVRYDIAKYNFLADILPDIGALILSPKSRYKTLDDLRKAKGIKAGATTVKGRGATGSAVMFEILGLDGKVVTGYRGKKASILALARGEVDLSFGSDATAARAKKAGNAVPLFVAADHRSPLLPKVPTLGQLGVKIPKELEDPFNFVGVSGKMVATTPGVPRDRVEYLRNIFKKLSKSEKIQKAIRDWAGAWRDFVPGEKLQAYMTKMKENTSLARQVDTILEKYIAAK